MIRRSVQFLKNNRFATMLWLGIALLLLSSHRSLSFQQSGGGGGQRGNTGCGLAAGLQAYLINTIGCIVSGPPQEPDGIGDASRVRFELNVGQADASYGFVAHGRQQSILLSSTGAVFQLHGAGQKARTVLASLAGARADAEPRPEQPLSGHVNYLIGRDPARWHTDIPTFGSVRFAGIYPAIDVVYHGSGGDLETDFVVQPGGDPEAIRIRFDGSDEVRLERDGSLAARAETRTLNWKKPVLYQVGAHGAMTGVEGRFKLAKDGAIGFEVGVYDVTRPLVIDPVLTYATYFGSPYGDGAARVAADASGNAYIVGSTDAPVFQTSPPGVFYTSAPGAQGNMLVAKMAADGKSMVYETHIGGSNGDLGWGIALDATGNVYLTGSTASGDFPLVPATNNQTTKSLTDPMNCFITKLNAAGNALIYSMVMGGTNADGCSSIGVDSSGNAYVTGATNSTDLPTVNPIQSSLPSPLFGTASVTALVAKVSPDGTKLLYSTYFGGPGNTIPTSVAVDGAGNAYFTGFTTSSSFAASPGALQSSFGGSGGQNFSVLSTGDAFVVKMSPSGQKIYATYLGGAKDDIGMGIAIDSKGDVFVGGATLSTDFPMQNAFQSSNHGSGGDAYGKGGDGFITELDPTGSKILFSSYIGGSADDRVTGVALDSNGNIYLAGHTLSKDFPTAGAQAQTGYAGDKSTLFRTGDAFLAEISAGQIAFSTYLGGSGGDWAGGVAVDGLGGVVIAGGTISTDFPSTTGVYQAKYAGADPYFAGVPVGDAFIARFGGAISTVSITGISNAASYVGGGIAPGEAVYISGKSIGPATLATAQLDSKGNISSLVAGTQFLFNNVPAPIVYVSATQSSVIVPYEVSTAPTVSVVAVYNGTQSPPFTMSVVPAVPGIFSANSSGTGTGAILNQDQSYNSTQNPAARGSIVALFVTGEGQTSPGGADGRVTATQITPLLPVTVSFGGVQATSYPFIGELPNVVAGVLQVNVVIPAGAPTGNVPLSVAVGSNISQPGLTISVK
jgi:uncharacterized protein (TIGR03437 family)